MNHCKFCARLASGDGIIWENKYYFSRFDGNPVSPGHALLIPKKHIDSISDLSEEEKRELINSIEDVKNEIKKAGLEKIYLEMLKKSSESSKRFIEKAVSSLKLNSEISGYNFGINEGESAGQTIRHLHIHIIPRYIGDVEDPAGGVRNTIPGMGNYKK